MKTLRSITDHCVEDIAVELRYVVAALRGACILVRGRPLEAAVVRLREMADATLALAEAEDLEEGCAEFGLAANAGKGETDGNSR